MKLHFHTNLDEAKGDVASLSGRYHDVESLPVPRKGERIEFSFGPDNFHYHLEIVGVVYKLTLPRPYVDIELHMPSYHGAMTIAEWSTWFNRHRFGR